MLVRQQEQTEKELSVRGVKAPILKRTCHANVDREINVSTRKNTKPNEDDKLQKTMVLVISPKHTNPVFDALSVSVTQRTSAFSAGRNSPQSPIPIPALYMRFSEHNLINKFNKNKMDCNIWTIFCNLFCKLYTRNTIIIF